MASSLASDFKIYQAEFQAGLWESLNQNVQAFNGASANAIRLISQELKGQYAKDAFFKSLSGIVTRRDLTSTSTVAGIKLTQDENVSVKSNRKIGPIEVTLGAIKLIAKDDREVSFILGEMVGQAKTQDMLNTGIMCVEAALEGQSDLVFDATGESVTTLTTAHLVSGLAKMGDAGQRVIAWVMYSKPYYDLVKEQIAAKITNVADRVVYGGTPATLGRPVIIADIPALHDANASATDTYNILGLVRDGVTVTESEQSEMVSQVVTGLEQLTLRMQGEYAMNLGVKGFAWDVTHGTANPLDATLATTSNWDLVASDVKDCAGVRIKVQ
jgi:hypothetical protein